MIAVIKSDAAVDVAAADCGASADLIDRRVPSPQFLARARVQRKHHAPSGDAVKRVVPHQRRAFLVTAARAHDVGPRETQALGMLLSICFSVL